MSTIHSIAAEVERLFAHDPALVDTTLGGFDGQQQCSGYHGHPARHDGGWPSIGWYDDHGNTGHPVLHIHPECLDIALAALTAHSRCNTIQQLENILKTAKVVFELGI